MRTGLPCRCRRRDTGRDGRVGETGPGALDDLPTEGREILTHVDTLPSVPDRPSLTLCTGQTGVERPVLPGPNRKAFWVSLSRPLPRVETYLLGLVRRPRLRTRQ